MLAAFDVCADLVTQMVPYCQRTLAEFGGDQTATAKAVFQGLLNKRWCTAEQNQWIMRKTVQQLGWVVQESDLAFEHCFTVGGRPAEGAQLSHKELASYHV
ncbi:hypothetical protein [Diaphorobacter sp. ED-3]|uniref:hypothetical protein n=1 Tax=Diaphorobacter sp. ED-3 TaxID=3016636 RepID=UPI0022DDC4DD|nr:hypothetical protein [Diaphorobacter sp. ED-3]